MKSPQVIYDVERSTFVVRSDDAHLDTFFVFPPQLQEGDRLPSLLFYIPECEKAFQFDGQYNPQTDNLEFLFDGPSGYSFKVSLSIDPGSEKPYIWKAKKHGQTTNFESREDAVIYVPKYVCTETATSVSSEKEVLSYPTFYGTTIQPSFCTMRLKIGVVEGDTYYSKITDEPRYEFIHIDYRKGDNVPEGVEEPIFAADAGKGDGKKGGEEKTLVIDRAYEVTITTDTPGKVERRAKRSERVQVFDTLPPSGDASFSGESKSGSGSVSDSKSTVSSASSPSTESSSEKDKEKDKEKSAAEVIDTAGSKKKDSGEKSDSSPSASTPSTTESSVQSKPEEEEEEKGDKKPEADVKPSAASASKEKELESSSSSSESSVSESGASKEPSKVEEKPTSSAGRKSKMIRISATATKARPSGSDGKGDTSKKSEEAKESSGTSSISSSRSSTSSSSSSARELAGKESREQKDESAPYKEVKPSGKESSGTSSKETSGTTKASSSDTKASSSETKPSSTETKPSSSNTKASSSKADMDTGKEQVHIQLDELRRPGAEKKGRGSSISRLLKWKPSRKDSKKSKTSAEQTVNTFTNTEVQIPEKTTMTNRTVDTAGTATETVGGTVKVGENENIRIELDRFDHPPASIMASGSESSKSKSHADDASDSDVSDSKTVSADKLEAKASGSQSHSSGSSQSESSGSSQSESKPSEEQSASKPSGKVDEKES